MKYKVKTSSSIVSFGPKAEKTWGLARYRFPWDIFKPVVFFGLYHVADYAYFLLHRGKKMVLWAGSDLLALKKNKLMCFFLKKAPNYVENGLEQDELAELGVNSVVSPSFVEDINDFPITFKPTDKPYVFLTCHPDRENEYGVGLIERIAPKVPECVFHIYGASKDCRIKNVIFHKRVPPDQFNKEIKRYHCGLRPNEHDGNSEIAMKSVLSGGYPITRIKYPYIDSYETEEQLIALLKNLKNKERPNYKAREFWRENLNQYPWNE